MIRFGCVNCNSVLKVQDNRANTKVMCPICKKPVQVPATSMPAPEADLPKSDSRIRAAERPSRQFEDSPRSGSRSDRDSDDGRRFGNRSRKAKARNQAANGNMTVWLIAGGAVVVVFLFCGGLAVGLAMLANRDPGNANGQVAVAPNPGGNPNQVARAPVPEKRPKNNPAPKPKKDVQAANGPMTGQQVYEQVLKSTVWIENGKEGSGTGVLIDADEKLVLTNCHVVLRNNLNLAANVSIIKTLQTINGKLVASDPRDRDGRNYKSYPFRLTRGTAYQFDMKSTEVDSYLMLLDPKGGVVSWDDDSGGNLNARIRYKAEQDGQYQIIASVFDLKSIGSFQLLWSTIDLSRVPANEIKKVAPTVTATFPIFADGQVVADRSRYFQLVDTEPQKHQATVVAYSEAQDLAVLRLNYVPDGVPALPLAQASSRPGQPVHSIGNPGASGAMWVYTSGTVRTAPYQKRWQSNGGGMVMQHDALIIETQSPTNPGDSGGPLVNESGELVAVTQGIDARANSINIFIDIGEVKRFLTANNLAAGR